jgi:hypothetical protein
MGLVAVDADQRPSCSAIHKREELASLRNDRRRMLRGELSATIHKYRDASVFFLASVPADCPKTSGG